MENINSGISRGVLEDICYRYIKKYTERMDMTGGVKQEFQARKMKLHKGNLVEILGLKDALKIKTNHWMKLMAENVQ